MRSTFQVIGTTGEILGSFDELGTEIRDMLAANPGAEVKPVVTIDNPCASHPAFEADNCPSCGTGH